MTYGHLPTAPPQYTMKDLINDLKGIGLSGDMFKIEEYFTPYPILVVFLPKCHEVLVPAVKAILHENIPEPVGRKVVCEE